MNRLFIYTDEYSKCVKKLVLSLDNEKNIEQEIMNNPEKGDLIVGSGGLRKIRFPWHGKGKSGGLRIIYLDLPSYKKTYLVTIVNKTDVENLSKAVINQLSILVKNLKQEAHKNEKRS